MLGGGLPHNPAHRIDGVGFATTVGANDANQLTRQLDFRWINERLKTSEFDFTQSHDLGARQR